MRQEDLIKIRHSDMANRMGEGEREWEWQKIFKFVLRPLNLKLILNPRYFQLSLFSFILVKLEKNFALFELDSSKNSKLYKCQLSWDPASSDGRALAL